MRTGKAVSPRDAVCSIAANTGAENVSFRPKVWHSPLKMEVPRPLTACNTELADHSEGRLFTPGFSTLPTVLASLLNRYAAARSLIHSMGTACRTRT